MGGKKSNRISGILRRSFKAIRTWQLFLVLIPLVFFTATLLRFDHLKMVELRDAVLTADEVGNEEDLKQALTALRDFTYSHTVINITENNGIQMITFGTGPFYLENQYLRAANAAIEAAREELAVDTNPNGNIYAAVAAICQPQAIAGGWQWSDQRYLDCWTSELAKYPESDIPDNVLTAKVPSTELYRYNYASPIFSWTPTGFAILACIILSMIIIVRFLIWCVLKIALLFLKNF